MRARPGCLARLAKTRERWGPTASEVHASQSDLQRRSTQTGKRKTPCRIHCTTHSPRWNPRSAQRAANPKDARKSTAQVALCARKKALGEPAWEIEDRQPSRAAAARGLDRKSTRLNSSHANISYAV